MYGFRQEFRQNTPSMLARPGDPKAAVRLDGDVWDIAAAAAAAAACRVPVDVAVWVTGELLVADPGANATTVHATTARLVPAKRGRGTGHSAWIHQLRHGSPWAEDTLPTVWMPVRVVRTLNAADIDRAVAATSDQGLLRSALGLECAAAAAGLTLSEAVSRRAAARAGWPVCARGR